jgi:hypothetical protein
MAAVLKQQPEIILYLPLVELFFLDTTVALA